MNRRLLAAGRGGLPGSLLLRPLRGRDRPGDDQGRERRGRPDRQLVHRRPLALRPLQPALRARLRLVDHDRPRLAAQVRGDRLRAGDPLAVGLQPLRLRPDGRPARVRRDLHRPVLRRPPARWSACEPRASTSAAGDSAGPRAGSSTTRWSACSVRAGSTSTSRAPSRPRAGCRCGCSAGSRGRRRSARARSRAAPSRCPGSGGFLLTDHVAYLEDYLTPGKEIGVFESPDDLVAQVRWWLEHEDERAQRGRGRLPPGARGAHLRPPASPRSSRGSASRDRAQHPRALGRHLAGRDERRRAPGERRPGGALDPVAADRGARAGAVRRLRGPARDRDRRRSGHQRGRDGEAGRVGDPARLLAERAGRARELFEANGLEADFVEANALELPDEVVRWLRRRHVLRPQRALHRAPSATGSSRPTSTPCATAGIAIVSVPNARNAPYRASKWLAERTGRWKLGVEVPFTRSELEEICRAPRRRRAGVLRRLVRLLAPVRKPGPVCAAGPRAGPAPG